MWKEEFKRNFFNIRTVIIIVVLIFLGIMSFFYSFQEKNVFKEMLVEQPEDVNLDRVEEVIEGLNGIQFNINYILQSDFFEIYVIILLLFCGIFLSSRIREMVDNGQINYILPRVSYKKYAKNLFVSQSLYIVVIVSISILISFLIGYVVGGIGNGLGSIGDYSFGFAIFIGITIIQILLTSLFMILVNGISLFLSVYIKKKLVIQCLPFFIFLLLPLVISSTIGNLFYSVGTITSYFVPFQNLKGIYWLLQYYFYILYILAEIVPYTTYTVVLFVIYKKNIKHFSEDCI